MSLVHLLLLQERLSDLPPLVLPPCPAGLHSHNHVKSVPKLWDQRCGWVWQGGGIYILDLFIQSLHVLVTLWCSIWFKQPNVKSAMCMFFSFWPSHLYIFFPQGVRDPVAAIPSSQQWHGEPGHLAGDGPGDFLVSWRWLSCYFRFYLRIINTIF